MYQIFCDDYPIYDPRDGELIVDSPKCKLKANTVGEASFSVFATHPYYSKMQKLKSVFEIRQDGTPIFRGRMTDDSKDFNNIKSIDIEGVLAYLNDSVIRPYNFPEDFLSDSGYKAAAASGNVVEFFLGWLINQHNSQVQPFQKFKLGKVTVADPNNYVARSDSDYKSTWEIVQSKLFNSALGGYLCVRYEEDGNYIDYLADFELTNVQHIVYGENLLDIISESDATATYSAMIPLGAKMNEINEESEDDSRLSIAGLPDGKITDDLMKSGDTIYSISAVERFGWIYAPVSETTWEDVTLAENLKTKSVEAFTDIVKFLNTITIKAVDLHFSDAEIESFRMYRYTVVESMPHDHHGEYPLSELDIDLLNPQNTIFVLGFEKLSLTDINNKVNKNTSDRIDIISSTTGKEAADISEIKETVNTLSQETADMPEIRETIRNLLNGTANLPEIEETVNSLSSDTGWINLDLENGISVGTEFGYLKARLKNDVLYIKGDIMGMSANISCVARVPEELIPENLSVSFRFVANYSSFYFCTVVLTPQGELLVISNSFGEWDGNENISINVSTCV